MSKPNIKKGLVWLRRDLRLHDNTALNDSINENDITYLLFIFDTNITSALKKVNKQDRRIQFICESLLEISLALKKANAGIIIISGDPTKEIPNIVKQLGSLTVYFNRDYAPYPLNRDKAVINLLKKIDIKVKTSKDHVIFEPTDILNKESAPYKVFTPYSRAWIKKLEELTITSSLDQTHSIKNDTVNNYKSVDEILNIAGFKKTKSFLIGGTQEGKKHIQRFKKHIAIYDQARDFPSLEGTSKLSTYIRHGCISIRELLELALESESEGSDCWLNELIWREFYQMILFQFPYVTQYPFKKKYKGLIFPGQQADFSAWKDGLTGFPIIDASMRCLNETGWMHNRLRMVTASFLCKILLVDWRLGESYFAEKLLDYELASNNGGWQWASGTGCDAAPYFRIFNPYTQSKKFDSEGFFIKKYCPELSNLNSKEIHQPFSHLSYPNPIVDYSIQRQRALMLYNEIKDIK